MRSTSNTFLERTIENWLTKTNELGYQLPFCQVLVSEGYSICHISKHNAFEQGKDIISLNKRGVPCVFQLKGGQITNSIWRKVVKDEAEELIDYTITHPSVDKRRKHIPYLVTNGYLEDTVRLAIDNLNAGKWKHNPLQVITKGELLKKFLQLSRNFVPQEINDYKSFLDLYFADGRELIDESKYSKFISDVLRLNDAGLKNEERKRNIAAAILYTSYIISPFKSLNNHISIIQALTLLGAHIFALVEKFNLKDGYWLNSFELIWSEIKNTGALLQNEIKNDGLAPNNLVNSLWDGEISPYRKHLATSYLIAYKVAQIIERDSKWKQIGSTKFFEKIEGSLSIWGEASVFSFILMFEYLNKLRPKNKDENIKAVLIPLMALIILNGRKSKQGLPSPYYGVTTLIRDKFGLLDQPIYESFVSRSFTIKSLIDLLVRFDRRGELDRLWREITYIAQERFAPGELWMHFLWNCDEGKQISEFPKQTQGWKELVEETGKVDLSAIPEVLQRHPFFVPLFLLAYPHRMNSNYVKFLDNNVV
jgi:hypothetical protein